MQLRPQLSPSLRSRKPSSTRPILPEPQKPASTDRTLLARVSDATIKPLASFAVRAVAGTVAGGLCAGVVAAATIGGVALGGPWGLLVPVAAGIANYKMTSDVAKKYFPRRRGQVANRMGSGAAQAAYGVTGLIGATVYSGLPITAAAGAATAVTTAAGIAGGIGLAVAVGAICGGLNGIFLRALD